MNPQELKAKLATAPAAEVSHEVDGIGVFTLRRLSPAEAMDYAKFATAKGVSRDEERIDLVARSVADGNERPFDTDEGRESLRQLWHALPFEMLGLYSKAARLNSLAVAAGDAEKN